MRTIAITIIFTVVLASAAFFAYYKFFPKEAAVFQKAEPFFVKGTAKIKSKQESQWRDIAKDTIIRDGDTITTLKNANIEIKFGQSQENYLLAAANTTVEIKRLDKKGNKKVFLRQGKTVALVKKLDEKSTFELRTPQAICGVLGTGFDAETTENITVIRVYEGQVYIKGINKLGFPMREEMPIGAGKKVKISKDEAEKQISDLTDDEKKAWVMLRDSIDEHLFVVFNIYIDKDDPGNRYTPSGWVGDYDAIRREESSENPYSGSTCLKFVYTGKTPQGAGWSGVYWQNPVNNWGEVAGGYYLKGARKLTFWARGEKGGEIINRFGIGGIGGNFPDSATREIGPVTLTNTWQQYEIDLKGLDLSSISGGFYWMTDNQSCPDGAVFYLDDIKYE
ncbi:MAG: FecR family protein [Candidatus Omnitrophota bacterium]